MNGEDARARLATSLFDLGTALADLEFRIAFANHIDSAAAFDHLAIGVAVLQGADTADNFHRIDLVGRSFIFYSSRCTAGCWSDFSTLARAEYSVFYISFNGKQRGSQDDKPGSFYYPLVCCRWNRQFTAVSQPHSRVSAPNSVLPTKSLGTRNPCPKSPTLTVSAESAAT